MDGLMLRCFGFLPLRLPQGVGFKSLLLDLWLSAMLPT
jgi:hypothetical protein